MLGASVFSCAPSTLTRRGSFNPARCANPAGSLFADSDSWLAQPAGVGANLAPIIESASFSTRISDSAHLSGFPATLMAVPAFTSIMLTESLYPFSTS